MPKFTDKQLRDYLELYQDDPAKISKIAELFGVSIPAVSKRIKRLERQAAPQSKKIAAKVEANVFDIRLGLQRNYQRVEDLIASIESNGVAKRDEETGDVYFVDGVEQLLKALKESRSYTETALKVADTLYRVEAVQGFQDDVMGVLAEVDPALRARVLDKIRARRGIRTAFM